MKSAERGLQIWTVLCGCAHNRQTITYKGLAELIGMGAGTLAMPFGHVMRYCESRKLPALTSLVVKKDRGKPGTGLTTVTSNKMDEMREKVYKYNWYGLLPPSVDQLAEAYDS